MTTFKKILKEHVKRQKQLQEMGLANISQINEALQATQSDEK